MKRRVRVTAPSSNPFESNPMSTWMAQMGGQQEVPMDQQIVSIASEMLGQGYSDEDVREYLNNQGMPLGTVDEIMDSLLVYLDEQRDLSEAKYLEDELSEEQLEAERMAAEEEALEDEELQEELDLMYFTDSDQGYEEEDDAFMNNVIMRYGGKIPSKKQFIKTELKLKRKQEGGPEKSDRADDTMSNDRPNVKLISSIASNAQQKAQEEELEQQYDQMFGNQQLPEAQFGGARNSRRAQRQMNRAMKRIPAAFFNAQNQFFPPQMNIMTAPTMFPQGFGGQGVPGQNIQLANIEVRRTGLFGKPKEYTINFNTVQPSQVKPQEIVDQEKQNKKQTEKDVETTEKEKETTTASTENEKVQEELITADQIEVVGSKKATSKPQAANVKRDNWGRPEGDKWFGFDPETKQYTDASLSYFKNAPFTYKSLRDREAYPLSDDAPLEVLKKDSAKVNPAIAAANAKKSPTINAIANKTHSAIPNRIPTQNEILRYALDKTPSKVLQPFYDAVKGYDKFADQFSRQVQRQFFQQQGGVTGYDLYKFIYGGDEPFTFADDIPMKDTTDPYFQDGGLVMYQDKGEVTNNQPAYLTKEDLDNWWKTTQEAQQANTNRVPQGMYPGVYNPYGMIPGFNQVGPIYPPLFGGRNPYRPTGKVFDYAGSWLQQQGAAYDPRTGKALTQFPAGSPLSKIDVTKSSMFGKRPKEYTMYFGDYGSNAPTPQITLDGNKSAKSQSSRVIPFDETSNRRDARVQNRLERRAERNIDRLPVNQVDYSADGMISPRDINTVDNLPTVPMKDVSRFESDVANELLQRQENELQGTPPALAIRRPEMFNTTSNIDRNLLQGENIEEDQIIGNLPIRRPYSEEQQKILQNFAPVVQSSNYSQDFANNLADERQAFDLERMQLQDPDFFNQIPYSIPLDLESLDYTELPSLATKPVTEVTTPVRTQNVRPITTSTNKNNNSKKRITSDVRTPDNVKSKQNITVDTSNKNQQQAILNRIGDINNLLSSWQPDWYKEQLIEERNALMNNNIALTPTAFRKGFQKGGVNFSYPYLPKAQMYNSQVGQTPITMDPRFSVSDFMNPSGMLEVPDSESLYGDWVSGMPGLNMPIRPGQENDPIQYELDPNQLNKPAQSPAAAKFKVKDMYNFDGTAFNDKLNYFGNMGLSFMDRLRNRDIENRMYSELPFFAQNAKETIDRGDYDPNSGLFRQDQAGFTGRAQKGGSTYKEGGETYMSAKQITEFLQNGGEIEFI